MTLGSRIKIARTLAKFTQEHVAEQFNLTGQAVSEWERDTGRPDIDKLAKLARILNTTTDWLLDGKGPPERPRSNDPLHARLRELTSQEREMLSGMVEGLLRQRKNSA